MKSDLMTQYLSAVVRGQECLSQQEIKDHEVWEEEGDIEIPDIRDPRVRAQVKQLAEQQERRLEERLLAAGLHITQRKKSYENH